MFRTLKQLSASLKRRGLADNLQVLHSRLYDFYFDWKYGTDTRGVVGLDDLRIDETQKTRAARYQTTEVLPFRKLLRMLNIPPGKVFVDFGCGKGKALLIASEFGFKEAKGIEISKRLCEIATDNCVQYKKITKTKTNFAAVHSDALEYQFDDSEEVIFLYNPFNAYVLQKVLQNLAASIGRRKRTLWIIYLNPVHKAVLKEYSDFKRIRKFVYGGSKFEVYTNDAAPSPRKR